jgi:Histidine kinase-, DNA gyrase B-, and HSP90-like ATPase
LARIEHKPGPTIIKELSLRLYPTAMESFREAISNAFDEGSKKVEVRCSKEQIVVEDWGGGIQDINTFWIYGHDTKASMSDDTIGQKGLGKLALLRLKEEGVVFRTNNGEVGIETMMNLEGFDPPSYKAATRFLSHQGTQIVIEKPEMVPNVKELGDYLTRIFGLRLASGREILLNGYKLESKVDPKEDLLFRISGGHDVTGNMKQDKAGKGSVDLYVKHVYIRALTVDPERIFKGWVNCNALTPSTNRNDILVDEPVYLDFIDHLRQYVTRTFPKRDEDLNRQQLIIANELSRMLQKYLKHMNILPRGPLPFGQGPDDSTTGRLGRKDKKKRVERPEVPSPPEEERIKRSLKTDKHIKRTRKSSLGFEELWLEEGNEKEPLYFVEPNFLVYNMTNDLFKFAMKNKAQLGPKPLRCLPWLARVGVNMNPEAKKWDKDRFNGEVDRAMRYYLTQMGEITG